MKNFFRKTKGVFAGFMAGVLVMMAAPTFGAGEAVQALIDDTITLIIAGNKKNLPADYKVLNYNGYTYLPSRYVAEELGGKVSWDEATRTITIQAPPEKIVEKRVEVPVEVKVPDTTKTEEKKDDTTYVKLPTSMTKSKVGITLNYIQNIKAGAGQVSMAKTMISGNIKNESLERMYVDYLNATLEVDGKTYRTMDVLSSEWDQRLVNEEIKAKEEVGATFVFPKVDSSATNFKFKVSIRNQDTNAVYDYEIDFKGDVSDED